MGHSYMAWVLDVIRNQELEKVLKEVYSDKLVKIDQVNVDIPYL